MGNNENFWILDRPIHETEDTLYAVIGGEGEAPAFATTLCTSCGRLIQKRQIRDLIIELHGGTPLDFIWSDSEVVFVSDSVRELFLTSDLQGLGFRQAKVSEWWYMDPRAAKIVDRSTTGQPPAIYQTLVLGNGGSILPQNTAEVRSKCDTCGLVVYAPLQNGIGVDHRQWDGSDFFVRREFPGYVLVTSTAIAFLNEHGITNFAAIPAETFSMV
jgi:hypothetical protein